MADLKGGTTGQILSKATNTDMDFTWITNDVGDITAVTATSPLTGGGTSGAITVGIQDASTTQKGSVQLSDSTSTTSSVLASTPTAVKAAKDAADAAQTTATAAIPKSTVTTAGDVIYGTGSSTVTRLGIGTAGQVLTVNAGATAPSWATASSGGGMTSIASGSLSGSTVTLSSISGAYQDLVLVINNMRPSINGYNTTLRFNGDSGTNYFFAGVNASNGTAAFRSGSLSRWETTDGASGSVTTATQVYTFLQYANATTVKTILNNSTITNDAGQKNVRIEQCGWFGTAAAISSIEIYVGSGTFAAGTYTLYGVK
jgi:hypothetical protein